MQRARAGIVDKTAPGSSLSRVQGLSWSFGSSRFSLIKINFLSINKSWNCDRLKQASTYPSPAPYDHEKCLGKRCYSCSRLSNRHCKFNSGRVSVVFISVFRKKHFTQRQAFQRKRKKKCCKQKQQRWSSINKASQKQKTVDNNCWRYYTENGEHNVFLSNNMHYQKSASSFQAPANAAQHSCRVWLNAVPCDAYSKSQVLRKASVDKGQKRDSLYVHSTPRGGDWR